jgi:hypothetical protein
MIIPPPSSSHDDVATVIVFMVLIWLWVTIPFIGSVDVRIAVAVVTLFLLLVFEVAVIAWNVIRDWRVLSKMLKALYLVVLISSVVALSVMAPLMYTYLQALVSLG